MKSILDWCFCFLLKQSSSIFLKNSTCLSVGCNPEIGLEVSLKFIGWALSVSGPRKFSSYLTDECIAGSLSWQGVWERASIVQKILELLPLLWSGLIVTFFWVVLLVKLCVVWSFFRTIFYLWELGVGVANELFTFRVVWLILPIEKCWFC